MSASRFLAFSVFCLSAVLAGCGGGSTGAAPPPPPPPAATYTIGGTVSGLSAGASLVLLDNGADALTVSANGAFAFKTALKSGAAYAVTVGTQPSGESCTVANASGLVASANITNVSVSCAAAVASESLFYSFGPTGGTDGHSPDSLIVGTDGNFYGTTQSGGTSNTGAVFKISPAGAETLLYSFGASTSIVGYAPQTLLQGTDGNFYGVTNSGGTYGDGIAFQLTPAGAETVLHSFGDLDSGGQLDGLFPTSLILAADGNFYGTTSAGNASAGIAFKMTSSGTETVVHGFGLATGDGRGAISVIQGSDGNFYGVTGEGGTNNTGAVYKITPAGTETVLYSFGPAGGTDAQSPTGGLVEAGDGNFYGLTLQGGANGTGAVFKVSTAGSETVIYSFDAAINGVAPRPAGRLIQGSDGNLYGCTQHGGSLNVGTVFKLSTAGVHTVLHSFSAQSTDAAEPLVLLQVQNGDIYGTALSGGAHGTGAIFKITP